MGPTAAVWIGLAINVSVTVVGIFAAYVHIRERLVRMETQLEPLWRAYERRRGPAGTTGHNP